MKQSKKTLRERFESETDISVGVDSSNWQKYSKWLEKLKSEGINSELIIENNFLKRKLQEAIDILYQGVSERPDI